MATAKFTDLDMNKLAALRTVGAEFDRRRRMTPDDILEDYHYLLDFEPGARVDFTVRITGRIEQGDPTTARISDYAMAVRCLLAEIDPKAFKRAIARMRDAKRRNVRQSRRFAKVDAAIRNARIIHRAGSVKLADADAQLLVCHPTYRDENLAVEAAR